MPDIDKLQNESRKFLVFSKSKILNLRWIDVIEKIETFASFRDFPSSKLRSLKNIKF